MNDFFTGVLPWLLWVGRIALSAVAVLLLIRCGRTLLSGGKQESWGFLSLSNGARYPLYHWENMIGRARQADIRINFPSVSRSHAALCRDSEGIWRIYPIRTGGTLLNGTVVERPTALNPGDALSMGGVDIYFFPDQKQARRPVRTAASPGTLWLLTLFQVLMFLQFLPGLTAGASLPVCIGFGGLVLLSWVFCSLRRTGSRGLEVLALLLTTVGFAVTAAYDSHSLYKQLAAVVLGMGLYLLMGGSLTILDFAGFLVIATKLTEPALTLVSSISALRGMALSGERLDKVMTMPDPSGEDKISHGDSYAFDSVSFHYAADSNVIHGVSFETPAGALTALVGPSGSGKSTLLRLMARFWDYQQGQVRFAGKELRSIAPESLLSQVSMVMQNAYLFRGTIRENLCFGNECITEQQMLDACRKARCHDFVSALPEGYDTVVGEGGATLSGGERQRISLARAFLKDVPILLLDEPTASLDADNEAMVQRALDEISKERTIIMIAHRLKTVRGAQQILVLENGRITQKGTHNQLVGTDGLYSRLWELQNQAGNYTFKQS